MEFQMKAFIFIMGIYFSGNLFANQVCAEYKNKNTSRRDTFFCYTCPDSTTRNGCPENILTDCVKKNRGISFTTMSRWADTSEELNRQHWEFAGRCVIKPGMANPYVRMGEIIVFDE